MTLLEERPEVRPVDVPALAAHDIDKRFDGVHALERAQFSVLPGEIHALLGENGAGKSTLIKILTGVYAPDGGTIYRNGEKVEFANVRVANAAGVVALYQELSIIPTISVAENILLGEQTPQPRRHRAMGSDAKACEGAAREHQPAQDSPERARR